MPTQRFSVGCFHLSKQQYVNCYQKYHISYLIGSMYGIYANIWGIWMVNVTIYSIHGSYGYVYNCVYLRPQTKKISFTKGKYDAFWAGSPSWAYSEGIFLGSERNTRENKRRVSAHQHAHTCTFFGQVSIKSKKSNQNNKASIQAKKDTSKKVLLVKIKVCISTQNLQSIMVHVPSSKVGVE